MVVWIGFAFLYTALAVIGPKGLLETGSWPCVNQHLVQVRAWLGEDIVVPPGEGAQGRIVQVHPRLDVTPYFRTWVMDDPRERVLIANLACGVKAAGPERRLTPVRYVRADSLESQLQMERLECHVGSPLGPALLLLPLRVLLGSSLAAQWLGAILGGLAVALVDLLLAWWLTAVRGSQSGGRGERAAMLALAGLGTGWVWLVPQGEVWMFSQTLATCSLTLALVLTWRRRWLAAGLAFALAATSRPPVLLALPILLAILWHRWDGWRVPQRWSGRSRLRALALAAVFPAIVGAAHLTLNWARFGSPLEVGYRFMLTPPELREPLQAHGPISVTFLGRNVRYLLLQPPVRVTDSDTGQTRFPFLVSDPHGMGVFFVTPAFLMVFLTAQRHWRLRGLLLACWLSLFLVTVPALLYFNTGWVQWGGRYLLDAWPLWLMLTALGLQRVNGRVGVLLIALSAASNLWGALLTAGGWWP